MASEERFSLDDPDNPEVIRFFGRFLHERGAHRIIEMLEQDEISIAYSSELSDGDPKIESKLCGVAIANAGNKTAAVVVFLNEKIVGHPDMDKSMDELLGCLGTHLAALEGEGFGFERVTSMERLGQILDLLRTDRG